MESQKDRSNHSKKNGLCNKFSWGPFVDLVHGFLNSENNYKKKVIRLKTKEPTQAFVPKILVSWCPEWASCKGSLEPKLIH